MGSRTLVTVSTDGFRDYVELPDGRTFNMGSVSVLKLVTQLVPSQTLARRALDAFLKDGHATIQVNIADLEVLLRPKRSRWAVHENRLIPPDPRTPPRGASTMNPDQAQADAIKNQVEAIESHIAVLAQTAQQHAAGSASREQVDNTITTLKQLVAGLSAPPSGQSKNDTFYFKMAALETVLTSLDRVGKASPDAARVLAKLAKSLLFTPKSASTVVEGAIDEDAKTELELYMDNESRLYNQKKSILANILRKMKAGKYDHKLSPKLWMYWVDEGAKMYAREFGGNVKDLFPKDLREALAKDIADREKKLIEDGEYSHIKVAVEAEGPTTMPAEVQKAEDVAKGKVDDPYKGKDQSDNSLFFKLAGKWSQKGEKWVLDGKGDSIEKAEIQEIKGPGIPLFLLKIHVKDKGTFQAKKEFKKLTDAQKAGESWLKSDADGASLVLTDFKKVSNVTGGPEQVAKQMGVDDPYAGKDQSKNDTFYKLADTEIPLINEAIAQSVMAKVEGALQVVQASSKANTHLAKRDLHIISNKLASMLQEASLSDPELRPSLLDLATKADKIHAHFSPMKGA